MGSARALLEHTGPPQPGLVQFGKSLNQPGSLDTLVLPTKGPADHERRPYAHVRLSILVDTSRWPHRLPYRVSLRAAVRDTIEPGPIPTRRVGSQVLPL